MNRVTRTQEPHLFGLLKSLSQPPSLQEEVAAELTRGMCVSDKQLNCDKVMGQKASNSCTLEVGHRSEPRRNRRIMICEGKFNMDNTQRTDKVGHFGSVDRESIDPKGKNHYSREREQRENAVNYSIIQADLLAIRNKIEAHFVGMSNASPSENWARRFESPPS